ncbi:MAG: hypothetical protein ACREDL_05700, partial [Bradyrhizobium sp.]
YSATHANMLVRLPFREHAIDKTGVLDILEASGVGLPDYYRWRSRSGCTFCFFQQKIEWVRLMEEHPDAFEEAKRYERNAVEHGSPFTWSQGESLSELAQPNRIRQIQEDHARRIARLKARKPMNPLRQSAEPLDLDDLYGSAKVCLACHK